MKESGITPVILDAGDLLFTVPMLNDSNRNSEILRASAILNEMMAHPFDAINVGRRELAGGVTLLRDLAKQTKSTFISANLRDARNHQLLFDPFKIIKRNGLVIGVIGLSNMFPESNGDIYADDYLVAGDFYIQEIKEKVDVIIVLVNSEQSTYPNLTGMFPQSNFILTSGSTMLTRPMMNQLEEGPFLFSSGREGRYLNRIDISMVSDQGNLVNRSYYESKIKYFNRRINRYQDKDTTQSLDQLYKDQPNVLGAIESNRKDIKRMQGVLRNAVNTIDFKNVSMDKLIQDDPKVLDQVNKTIGRCAELIVR